MNISERTTERLSRVQSIAAPSIRLGAERRSPLVGGVTGHHPVYLTGFAVPPHCLYASCMYVCFVMPHMPIDSTMYSYLNDYNMSKNYVVAKIELIIISRQ